MTVVVRVHYEIDDELHRRVKMAAAAEGLTLKAYLEQALEAAASRSEAATAKGRPWSKSKSEAMDAAVRKAAERRLRDLGRVTRKKK